MNISDQLSEVGSYGGFFAINVGGDSTGWRDIRDCYADGFTDLVAETAQRYGSTDARVAASLVQMSIASRLWSPVLACAVGHGVVPDLGCLQRADDSAELRLPEASGSAVHGDLAATLYRLVVSEHLEPLADGLRVKVASGLLYGNAASALVAAAQALYWRKPEFRGEATELTRSILNTRELANTGTVRFNLAFRRRSCCLYYRVAGGSKCADCSLDAPRRN